MQCPFLARSMPHERRQPDNDHKAQYLWVCRGTELKRQSYEFMLSMVGTLGS